MTKQYAETMDQMVTDLDIKPFMDTIERLRKSRIKALNGFDIEHAQLICMHINQFFEWNLSIEEMIGMIRRHWRFEEQEILRTILAERSLLVFVASVKSWNNGLAG